MKLYVRFLFVISALLIFAVSEAGAFELSGHVTAEGRVFFSDPLFDDQRQDSVSLAIQPELYHEQENGSAFIFTPFARFDSADPERSHFDVRELNYLWLHDEFELRVGVGKVFWGVTEFLHLVDIVNQTDFVEDIDGEDKLGQPMAQLTVPRDWGVVEFFVLPYFRERTFPGEKGRFRSQVVVDADEADYESSAEEKHIDLALRYSHTIGDWDFGVYHFNGTGREPSLVLNINSSGGLSLIPLYEKISQTGLDVQMVRGNWLWKLETLYRSGQGDAFVAGIGGFEYSFVNINSTGIDLGLIGEWACDERGDESTTGFDNDLMVGARLSFNDAQSTEALAGLAHDLDGDGSILTFESSRRLTDHLKISLDMFFVLDSSEKDVFYSFREDDSMQVNLFYYF